MGNWFSSADVPPPSGAPVVVVVGGGYAGVTAARALDTKAHVVLVERKEYFFHNIGALRASVVGGQATENVCFPYTSLLKYGKVIQGEVEEIFAQNREIAIHGFQGRVKYDYLVLATGSSYTFPKKVAPPTVAEVRGLFDAFSAAVAKSKRVLIVGGGAVGIELAGEIHDAHPAIKVILAHGSSELLHEFPDKNFRTQARNRLEGLGIEVLLNERVPGASELAGGPSIPGGYYVAGRRSLRTQAGTEIPDVDLVVYATGGKTNSNAYANAGFELNAQNRIVVDQFLRVKGQDRIYAVGDCSARESKMGYYGRLQADAAVVNILNDLAGTALVEHKLSPAAMFLPIGQTTGVGSMNGWSIAAWLVGYMKGWELFTKDMKQRIGITGPISWEKKPVDPAELALDLGIPAQQAKALLASVRPIEYTTQDHN